MRRIISLLLALILVMTMLPMAALAENSQNQQADWTGRLTLNTGDGRDWAPVPNLSGLYDAATNTLTYYLTAAPDENAKWETDPHGIRRMRIYTKLHALTLDGTQTIGAVLPHYYHYESNGWQAFGEGNPVYANANQPVWFDIQCREDGLNEGNIFEERYMFQWMDTVENKTVLKEETITIRIVPAFKSTPVRANRIMPQEGIGVSKSSGNCYYKLNDLQNQSTVTTTVAAADGADGYIVNNSTTSPVTITNGKVAIETPIPQDGSATAYTIQWYAGDVMIATETLNVGFTPAYNVAFTPIEAWRVMPMRFRGIDETWPEGADTFENVDGEEIREGSIKNNDLITFTVKMKEPEWEEAFYYTMDAQSVSFSFGIQLPEEATAFNIVGTDINTTDDEFLRILNGLSYHEPNDDRMVWQGIDIAQAAYDGTSVILTPSGYMHSFGLKWMEANGVEHFHRINYKVEHYSVAAVKIAGIAPSADRITLNVADPYGGNNPTKPEIDSSASGYSDGVVNYYITTPANSVCTTIKAPVDGVAGVYIYEVSSDDYWFDFQNQQLTLRRPADRDRLDSMVFPIMWLGEQTSDEEDPPVLHQEVLNITVMPASQGVWLDDYWAPVPANRTGISTNYPEAIPHFTYDADLGRFTFEADAGADIDYNLLTSREPYFYIDAPEGAAYVSSASWHSPMYGASFAADTKIQLDEMTPDELKNNGETMLFSIKKENEIYRLYFGYGAMFKASKLSGKDITVYTVLNTMTGYSDSIHLQWYDKDGELIEINGKNGEYVHLIKEPFVQYAEEADGPVNEKVENPKVENNKDNNGGKKLRTEIPGQKEDGNGQDRYLYMYLKYLDANGNEVQPEEAVNVYLPYEYLDGVTYENAHEYDLTIRHYMDENHTLYKDVPLEPTPYGLRFMTESFSPFLVTYTKKDVVDNGQEDNDQSGSSLPTIKPAGSSNAGSGSNNKFQHVTEPADNSFGADIDMSLGDIVDSVLTEQEQNGSKPIEIELKVKDAEQSMPASEKKAFQKASEGDSIVMYLDITLNKQVGNGKQEKISETNGPVKISLQVPASAINHDPSISRIYYMMHLHNGVMEKIYGSFDPLTNTFSFETDSFSPYALAYTDTPALLGVPKTGGNSSNILGLALLAAGICAAGLTRISLKKKR